MENENQTQQESPNLNSKVTQWIIFYFHVLFRGIVTFLIAILLYFLFSRIFNLPQGLIIILTFIVFILMTPIFSKIKMPKFIIDKFLNLVNKQEKYRTK